MKNILSFTKYNVKFPFLPGEDSFKYLKTSGGIIIAVADGITRSASSEDYPSENKLEDLIRVLKNYPNPSPAKAASKKFCDAFTYFLKNKKKKDESVLLSAFKYANNGIRELNKKHIKKVDYLQNDFWACVASGGVILDKILYWCYICDCGVCVFDRFGRLKFRTPNDMEKVEKYLGTFGDKWRLASFKKWVRSKFRNNLKNTVNGKKLSYGALTGEKKALVYIKAGKYKLKSGDYVLFYSDGAEYIIYSNRFRKYIARKGFTGLKEFCKRISYTNNKYGREGTIVGIGI